MKFFCFLLFGCFTSILAASVPRSLQEDLNDFVALIPVSKLKEIVCRYKDDPEVQLAVQYLRSEEWASLVAAVGEKQSWRDFRNYLNDVGIDIESVKTFVHNLITNGVCDNVSTCRGLKDLFKELKAALPMEEIKALWHNKLENSADFRDLYAKVSSEKSRQLIEEVIALEEFKRVAAKLAELGFDFQKHKDIIYGLLEWN